MVVIGARKPLCSRTYRAEVKNEYLQFAAKLRLPTSTVFGAHLSRKIDACHMGRKVDGRPYVSITGIATKDLSGSVINSRPGNVRHLTLVF